MPWACSERFWVASLLTLMLLPAGHGFQAAHADSRWRRGVFPVAAFVAYTSHYGSRMGPGGSVEPHHGLDIAAPLGSSIHSWWGGVVQNVINDPACGIGLVIRSGPYEHVHCHLGGAVWGGIYRSGRVILRQGQAVATGQLIAHVGLTGRTTGPHLHWGVRHNGRWLDPARVLRAMAASRQAPKRQPPPRVGGSFSSPLQP